MYLILPHPMLNGEHEVIIKTYFSHESVERSALDKSLNVQ